jgi:hypothetical protein
MGRINEGPTPTTSKASPSFPSLGTAARPPSAGPPPTQMPTLATSTGGSASHDLRLLPVQSIDRAPRGWATMWRKLPHAVGDVQVQRGMQICPAVGHADLPCQKVSQ